MNVKNKTIVVTGAGNGMGKEITVLLLKKGASVAAVDLNETALEELSASAGEFKSKLSTYAVNIADKSEVEKLPELMLAAHGSIDGLINNAGIIQPFVRVNDLQYKDIERVMNVNFYGTLYMLKTFIPHLIKRNEAHIANVSSMGGFLPVPGQSVYGASKAAVKLMTEGLMGELMNTGIRVSIIYPGAIATNIAANSGVSVGNVSEDTAQKFKTLPASKAAEIIVSGIEKNKARIYVGSDSKMMALLYRLSPGFATRFIGKKMQALLPA